MEKIYIYGIGKLGQYFIQHFGDRYEIEGCIQTVKEQESFLTYPVYTLDEIDLKGETIFLTNSHLQTLLNLLERNVSLENIICCSLNLFNDYQRTAKKPEELKIDMNVANGYENYIRSITAKYVLSRRMNRNMVTLGNSNVFSCGIYENVIKNDRYCRTGVLSLAATEILRRGVQGDVAELGVYRGDFAQYINHLFPDRLLYLFDTFKGFVPEEMKFNIDQGYFPEKNYFNTVNDFTNTSVDLVLGKMEHPEVCVVKQGIFPDTVTDDIRRSSFAFVSLDTDLYIPIIEGLRFFYPRLSDGGYIMIHDYNNTNGVKEAVYDFEKENGYISKVPIPDDCGSVVIVK